MASRLTGVPVTVSPYFDEWFDKNGEYYSEMLARRAKNGFGGEYQTTFQTESHLKAGFGCEYQTKFQTESHLKANPLQSAIDQGFGGW